MCLSWALFSCIISATVWNMSYLEAYSVLVPAKPKGEQSSNWNKADCPQRMAQDNTTSAKTVSALRSADSQHLVFSGWHLQWRTLSFTGRTQSTSGIRKKKKAVSMTTPVSKLPSQFCDRGWHKLAIIIIFSPYFFMLLLVWLIYLLLSCLVLLPLQTFVLNFVSFHFVLLWYLFFLKLAQMDHKHT